MKYVKYNLIQFKTIDIRRCLLLICCACAKGMYIIATEKSCVYGVKSSINSVPNDLRKQWCCVLKETDIYIEEEKRKKFVFITTERGGGY